VQWHLIALAEAGSSCRFVWNTLSSLVILYYSAKGAGRLTDDYTPSRIYLVLEPLLQFNHQAKADGGKCDSLWCAGQQKRCHRLLMAGRPQRYCGRNLSEGICIVITAGCESWGMDLWSMAFAGSNLQRQCTNPSDGVIFVGHQYGSHVARVLHSYTAAYG